MKNCLLYIRPKHWIKNLLIFFPLIFGRKLFIFPDNFRVVIVFFLFTIASSAIYLVNDVLDREYDKVHPLKRLRPVASGKISVSSALFVSFALGTVSLIPAFLMNINIGWILTWYILFNFLYTLCLKSVFVVDIICLTVFFIFRLMAGGVAAEAPIKPWVFYMTILLCLFLGLVKRRQELKFLKTDVKVARSVLAKYDSCLIDWAIGALVFFILVAYIYCAMDARFLIFALPFVIFSVWRYLYLVQFPGNCGDPIKIASTDRIIQVNIFFWMLTCVTLLYR